MYLTQTHISPPKVVTQLPKPNKDLSISPFLVIDDNSIKIGKLSSFGFMLLAQANLPCENDFGQVPVDTKCDALCLTHSKLESVASIGCEGSRWRLEGG